jgi:hypothetical protein
MILEQKERKKKRMKKRKKKRMKKRKKQKAIPLIKL